MAQRPVLQRDEGDAGIGLEARDSRSKPEKVTTLATAGFFISAFVASAVTSRVREIAAACGSTVTRKT